MLLLGEPDADGARGSSLRQRTEENSMRLTGFFTAARLGSRHVALGVETALAMTLCLLVLRALTQF
jgi:hypothetical protein